MLSKSSLWFKRLLCVAIACLFAVCLAACSRDATNDSVFAHTRDSSESASVDQKSAQTDESEQVDATNSESSDGEDAATTSSDDKSETDIASSDGQENSADTAQSIDGQDTAEKTSESTDGQDSSSSHKNAASSDGEEFDLEDVDLSAVKDKGTILVLDLEGLSSSLESQDGEAESDSREKASSELKAKLLSKKEIAASLSDINEETPIAILQVSDVDSANITGATWIELAKIINKAASNNKIAGFVVVQGASTLDETAYFLNLTAKTDKAVVVTCTAESNESELDAVAKNVSQAVITAADSDSQGKGVLEVLSGSIYSARGPQKACDTEDASVPTTEEGYLGIVHDSDAEFFTASLKTHTTKSEFDVDVIESLPRVSIVNFTAEADARLIRDAAEHSDGLVVVGADNGEFSDAFKEAIDQCDIPVIVCSGTDGGFVAQDSLQCKDAVAAHNLTPEKAAVLLRLALTKTTNQDTLEEMFAKY